MAGRPRCPPAVGGSCSVADKWEDRSADQGVRWRAVDCTQASGGQGGREEGRVTGLHAAGRTQLGKDVRAFVRGRRIVRTISQKTWSLEGLWPINLRQLSMAAASAGQMSLCG